MRGFGEIFETNDSGLKLFEIAKFFEQNRREVIQKQPTTLGRDRHWHLEKI